MEIHLASKAKLQKQVRHASKLCPANYGFIFSDLSIFLFCCVYFMSFLGISLAFHVIVLKCISLC